MAALPSVREACWRCRIDLFGERDNEQKFDDKIFQAVLGNASMHHVKSVY